jgi:flavin-binding protein dodecin
MAVMKVIELMAQSEVSWEDAAQKALDEAAKSVRGIKSIYIQDMMCIVDDNQIVQYRVNCKVTFQVEIGASAAGA